MAIFGLTIINDSGERHPCALIALLGGNPQKLLVRDAAGSLHKVLHTGVFIRFPLPADVRGQILNGEIANGGFLVSSRPRLTSRLA